MPAQTTQSNAVYYTQGDTWPPLNVQLVDDDGNAIDLTGCTVTIDVAYQRWSYYYSPTERVVSNGACLPNGDQVTNKGWVSWTPQAGDLDIPGSFTYEFTVTFGHGGIQTFPGNTYQPLHVKTRLPG